MKKLKILFLSFLISCATVDKNQLRISIDLNLQNFKKHLELNGRKIYLDFVLFQKDGKPKTFSTTKKLSKNDYLFIEENLKNLNWDKIKDRYVTKDAIMMHLPPVLISISYLDKKKNVLILGDIPKEFNFLFKILDPYLIFDFSMLK